MPVETPSIFAQVIREHLDLKERNARLGHDDADRALQGRGSVREPSALQERGAGANRGDDGRRRARLQRREPRERRRLARRGAARGGNGRDEEATVPAIEESAFWGNGGGARLRLGRLTPREELRSSLGMTELRVRESAVSRTLRTSFLCGCSRARSRPVFRSSTNASISWWRDSASRWRRIALGWIVAVTCSARSDSSHSPRCFVTRN